jgi:hypothetical protein
MLFKPKAAYCQHHAETAFYILTYKLFKDKSSPLSALYGKGLLDPDLQPVQNPEQPIVSIMHKMPSGP